MCVCVRVFVCVCVCVCNLGEEPPPLPVLEFEVTGAVPLDHLHGRQLRLTFTESSEIKIKCQQQQVEEALRACTSGNIVMNIIFHFENPTHWTFM